MSNYVRQRTKDPELEGVQNRVEEAFQAMESNFISGAILIADIDVLAGTPKVVQHGLGYVYRGFIVVKMTVAATITDVPRPQDEARRQIQLNATANTKISILVF